MNLLFLIPPSPDKRRIVRLIECSHEAKAAYLWQPYDYILISSRLAPDDTAELVDGTADGLTVEGFVARLGEARPDVIILSLASAAWEWDLEIFRGVRERFPAVPLYVLGDLFLEEEYLSFILPQCEGVVEIPHLLELKAMAGVPVPSRSALPGLRQPGAGRSDAPKKTLRVEAGVPRHELFQKQGYAFPFARKRRFATVAASWGCPFSCFYCNQRSISPVVRPWREVAAELESLAALSIDEIFFADKAFGFPPSEIDPLLDFMAQGFNFSWSCYFHPQMYRPELLEKMRRAGCHTLIIGIESADQGNLSRYQRNVKPDKVSNLLDHANALGMDICADFIIGLEHESEEDIHRTIRYARELSIDFASFNVAAPLPGSGIREKLVKNGTLAFGEEGFDTLARSGVRTHGSLSEERILNLRQNAVRRFYLRPSLLWRRLRKTASLEHLYLQLRQMTALFRKNRGG